MRRASIVTLAFVSAAGWAAACGGSDDGGTVPDTDAGPDGSTTVDTGAPPPPVDSGADTGSDAGGDADASLGDAGLNLDGGLCGGGVVTLASAAPQFAWTGGPTPIAIAGFNFAATPKVYLRAAGGTLTQIQHVAYVSSTSLTAVIPSGFAAGTYDLVVVNPNTCASTLAGGVRVVTTAPPRILSVSPAGGTTQNDVAVTITGCSFPGNATLSTVSSAGAVVVMTSAAPVAGAADPKCGGGTLFTMQGTIETKTKTLAAGAYLVRVTNPTDGTFGEYASFVVTNPSGNLTGGFVASSELNTGRRSHGMVAGRVNEVSRYLYVIGGEQANGAPLNTVEVAPLERFGGVGAWVVQKNKLLTPRSGAATVQWGKWIYVIGGTDDTGGTGGAAPTGDALDDIERAKILDATYAPVVADPPTVTTGTLGAGTWYYKVSAIGADPDDAGGESIASDEVVANLSAAGGVTLTWPAITNATKYKVYRSQAADGVSQTEVFLAEVTPDGGATVSFTDNGSITPNANETYMALGATGQWEQAAQTIGTGGVGRLNASAAVAIAPGTTSAYLYVVGGWGRCAGDGLGAVGLQRCVEYARIDAATGDLDTFSAQPLALANARMRGGAAVLDKASGPPASFGDGGIALDAAFLVVAGGRGSSTLGNATNVEVARILGTGAPDAFFNPVAGFSNERDGMGFQIANGYAYALQGGTAPSNYTHTADQSTQAVLSTSDPRVTFSTWSNAAANLGGANKIGRHGSANEGAFFYIAGGTSNDTDALKTVWRVLH